MEVSRGTVLLIKAPKEGSGTDPYVEVSFWIELYRIVDA